MFPLQDLMLWIVSSVLLYITAIAIPGIKITSFPRAMLAALFIGMLNMLVKPFLLFIAIPINIITLGAFTLVINALIFKMAAGMLKGFDISGWTPAILGALMYSLLHIAMNYFV